MTGVQAIDGATVEVIRNYLLSTVEQMRRTLVRTAFNPVIYEVLDIGLSMYDSKLRLVAHAAGHPMFLGANDYGVVKAIEYVGAENLEPGDIVLMNYPYWSAAHAPDAMLFAPVFEAPDEAPVAYLCVRAHWMDLGAKDPAYVLDSTSIHQEGLIFPGTKLVKRGVIDEELLELIRFNSRLPDIVIGDFHAQVSAVRTGERRILEILSKFGRPIVEEAIEEILDHGERLSRRAVAALPDGEWTAVDWLDDDGISTDPIRMQVDVRIDGEEFLVDFSGSADAVPGPVNMPIGCTQSLAKLVFKGLTTPKEASNGGHYRNLHVEARPGTLFHAVYPASTYTLWTFHVAFELVHKALAPALPSLSASSGGDEPGFMATGPHPDTGETYIIGNNEGIGWGGTRTHDGADALQVAAGGVVRNTPIEVLERWAGLFHDRLELRTDSGGAGRFRGGVGIRRDVTFMAEGEVLSMKKKTKTKPWALDGGLEPPEPNAMIIHPDTDREIKIGFGGDYNSMFRTSMRAGDRFVNLTTGGGGYGPPSERDPALVREDVAEGYVSREAARDLYGVDVPEEEGG
jgi:N-methylhydantoinase B